MLASEWTKPRMLSHFTVVCKLEDGLFPMGFSKEAAERNSKAGLNIISMESTERALLNWLMIELHKLDSDILVGHNISGFDLDVLLNRVKDGSNALRCLDLIKEALFLGLEQVQESCLA